MNARVHVLSGRAPGEAFPRGTEHLTPFCQRLPRAVNLSRTVAFEGAAVGRLGDQESRIQGVPESKAPENSLGQPFATLPATGRKDLETGF